MPAIRAPGRQSRDVTNRPTLSITHRYIYFAGTLARMVGESGRTVISFYCRGAVRMNYAECVDATHGDVTRDGSN
jgi:hypothetical protein